MSATPRVSTTGILTIRISFHQVLALGNMTLPDGPTGLAIVSIDSISFGVARSSPH